MLKVRYFLGSIMKMVEGLIISLIYFKNLKVYLCNHITARLKYLHDQGVIFPHPVGIVIGAKVTVGKDCHIYQNVTIGTKDTKNYLTAPYPVIGDNVTIYANAVVFGDITVGDNSIIGPGTIVNKSVPKNSIVVGNPMKILKNDGEQ